MKIVIIITLSYFVMSSYHVILSLHHGWSQKRHVEGSHLTTFGREQFDCLEHLAEVKSQTRDLGPPEGKLSIVKLDVRHLELGLGLGLELELGLALVDDKQGVALV